MKKQQSMDIKWGRNRCLINHEMEIITFEELLDKEAVEGSNW